MEDPLFSGYCLVLTIGTPRRTWSVSIGSGLMMVTAAVALVAATVHVVGGRPAHQAEPSMAGGASDRVVAAVAMRHPPDAMEAAAALVMAPYTRAPVTVVDPDR